ncbi:MULTISPECIES: aspartate aminotransferase family protein [unclassified Leucobacter]|uniref:aspartate aminotransferase family protein n=1 Tax=unclassified Leucobacter TaxID=2621730 RepID=UPI00165D7C55|nr:MULTISPECIES: aspartate aminotransferase family protein [unclassified Leucobacter]MBC9927457.1 aspartate aminotransferase family protein [Leucobacter sp. cx-169]MBC9936511.1 aspartate aminotransferase family protein [Leucobacter sp. cx-87]
MADYIDLYGAEQTFGDNDAQREVRENDKQYVFHSWSAQGTLNTLPIAKGEGVRFWDYDGTEYLDFSSQLVNLNLGHQHPGLVKAIQEQAGRLATIQPALGNDVRGELAKRIVEKSFEGARSVFFTNGGADAVEYAVRMARHHTGKHKVLARYRSYHGSTGTAITLTGEPRRWANGTLDSGVVHFTGPYPYRSAFYAETPEQETERALAHLRSTIVLEGASTIAAIILESVTGTNGILIPTPGYLEGVRALCDEFGILLICDEVMAGFGRTGEWFAFQGFNVAPDLITFAKGVNSGYVPLGGVVISEAIHNTFDQKSFPGGLTYSGHPLACAAGVATFDIFEEEQILERVRDLGERVVRPRLEAMAEKHPSIGEVRGKGLFWALELVVDRETREPLVPFNAAGEAAAPFNRVVAACKAAGLWPFAAGNRLQIAPPLIISEEDLITGLDIIDAALDVADAEAAALRK